ncbi:4Fe-4S dicluster domain-containing protein [Roseovarius sp. MBR-6]|jgi:ferredoxin|uniref:4Fe-4S dicluster domain-containing protein n=1 Tax=Roseovarius sp. MBR-6 TaxID=3156459 RepID=UPI003399386C
MYPDWQREPAGTILTEKDVRRPPGTAGRQQLAECCSGCGDCVAVCPSEVLALDPLGYPHVTSERGLCEQCGLCADVCVRGAIVYTAAMLRARERALASDGEPVLCVEDLRSSGESVGTI